MKKHFILLIILTLLLTSIATFATPSTPPCDDVVISSYLPLYHNWKAEAIKGDQLTDVLIAFAQLDSNYKLYFPDYYLTDIAEAKRLKELYPNLNVSLSIGGWGATGFSEMTASSDLRSQFVADVMDLIITYDLDGVDMDWEYPVGEGWQPEENKHWADRENFTLLMQELRIMLDTLETEYHQEYILSYATNVSSWAITNLEYEQIFDLCDRIYLMCYAFEGQWSAKTGHASNLFHYPESTWGVNCADTVELFKSYGAASDKLVLGIPAFSQPFNNVSPLNNGLGQPFTPDYATPYLTFKALKDNYINKNGFIRYWDDHARQPYLFDGKTWISYDDEQSIAHKMDYIFENNLGGIMTWEYFQDGDGDLLAVMNTKVHDKLMD